MSKHRNIKEYLYLLAIVLLILPQVINYLGVITPIPLKGSLDKQESPLLTVKSWFSADYQNKKTVYFNENFGCRNTLVRLNNQLNYSLFHTTNAREVVIGKENYLYEEKYILGYLGRNSIGAEKNKVKIEKLKKIQDTLSNLDIKLFVVLAAGKASYFPEFIPDKYNPDNKEISNYDLLHTEMHNQGINYLDFNKWFLEMKDTSSHKLYPKGGIHWSKYGELIAEDSIIKFIQKKWNYQLAQIKIDSITRTNKVRSTDDDVEGTLNIFTNLPDFTMSYPHFRYIKNKNTVFPKLLVIADSYYWGLYSHDMSKEVFNNGEFWFYNNQIYSEDIVKDKYVININYQKELENNDIIMLLSTETNFNNFDFGFIDKAYEIYFGDSNTNEKLSDKVQYYIDRIKNDPNWLSLIKDKSIKENIGLDEMIKKDATYMARNNKE